MLFPEEAQKNAEKNADDDRGSQWKVESDVPFADDDVTWQPAEPRDPRREEKEQSHCEKYHAEEEEKSGDIVHNEPLSDMEPLFQA